MISLQCPEGHLLPEFELVWKRSKGTPPMFKARCRACGVTVRQPITEEMATALTDAMMAKVSKQMERLAR